MTALLCGCKRDKPVLHGESSDTRVPLFGKDIAPFIFKNCSGCHSAEGMAPFALTNYKQIAARAGMIQYVLEEGLMPPWKPDATYSEFTGQVKLDAEDIRMFRNWVMCGKPKDNGDENLKYAPVKQNELADDSSIIYVTAETEFVHPGDGLDHYAVFTMPLDSKKGLYVRKIELVNQNKKIMHHAWLGCLPEGIKPESVSPEMLTSILVAGFLPGMTSTFWPEGYYKYIEPGTRLLVSTHYAHYNKQERDRPQLKLYTIPKPPESEKQVKLYMVLEDSLLENTFALPKDTITELHIQHTLHKDMLVLALTPHMHFRGQKFTAFALRPASNDTIPLIRINDWDFNWQNIYYYKNPVQLKAGDVVNVIGTFNNTAKYIRNPVVPTVEVKHGDRSLDEMLEMMMEVAN